MATRVALHGARVSTNTLVMNIASAVHDCPWMHVAVHAGQRQSELFISQPPVATIALYLSAFAPNEELALSMRCVAV